jgi:hypothetical protein
MDIIAGPAVVDRPATHYLGIRQVTPFRGMLAVRDQLLADLPSFEGPYLFRLHVIDMNGPMDIEVGIVTPEPMPGADRVRPGVLPAGRYAHLTYRNHSRRANGLLLDWVRDAGLTLDRWDTPDGDAFGCRYEAYLTDPRTQPRKTMWDVSLNIKLA